VEWFVEEPGNGAGTLALLVARQACQETGTLVVLDEARRFYPPAAAACGIDLRRLIVVHPRHARDALWAWDQALRCPAVKAVWGWLETINDRWFRRFQLAAERSGCLGLLLRPGTSRGKPSWSELQLAISARGMSCAEIVEARRMRVEVVRCRGAAWPEGLAGLPDGPATGALAWATAAEQGGAAQSVMHLRLEERQGQLQVIAAPEHETTALPLFSQLAPPAFSRGASGI
jgi:cell division inhibitor SulA